MRELPFLALAVAWPLLAAAQEEPILLKPPLPDGLVPPELTNEREPLPIPRPPQRVLNGHGTVVICFLLDIGSDGHTRNVSVLQDSDDYAFDEDMAKALLGLRWKPAQLAGKPVAVRAIFPSVFQGQSLRGADAAPEISCSWDLYKPAKDAAPAQP
jgi:hypothetical protein